LRALLSRTTCLDVYYSTSTWLNPHKLGRRSEEDIYDSLFLKNDIFFDIDFKPFSAENLEKARQEAIILLAYLRSRRIPVKYMAFSGSKGFHISCQDSKSYAGNPLQRELATLEARKALVAEVESEGIKIDGKITADTRRIVRVPGTVNSKSGYMCRLVDEDELIDSSAKDILKKTPKKTIVLPPKRPRQEQDDVHLGIKTNIAGTKRGILSMTFRSYRQAKHALISLEDYGIPIAFLLKKGRSFNVISPVALDTPRLLKICNRFSKGDQARYSKYGYTTFPADAKPLYHRILSPDRCHTFSRSHLAYLLQLFRLPPMEERMCGKEELSMDIGLIE
jgi:hypothetical protein